MIIEAWPRTHGSDATSTYTDDNMAGSNSRQTLEILELLNLTSKKNRTEHFVFYGTKYMHSLAGFADHSPLHKAGVVKVDKTVPQKM